jgi:hypothetical protein
MEGSGPDIILGINYLGICMEGLKEIRTRHGEVTCSPNRDVSPGSPAYEIGLDHNSCNVSSGESQKCYLSDS